ncbi:hypothetical protein DRP04_12445, partial [Archaeoglobales archaeon]
MVKLYLICRDCKAIEHVGFGDYDVDSDTLKVEEKDVSVSSIIEFLVKHRYHDVSLVTEWTADAEYML